jgi:hypothetical protein
MGGGNYGMVGYYQNTTDSSDAGFACVLDQYGNQLTSMLFNGEVKCATSTANGRIVLGGKFTQVTSPVSASRNFIAAITTDFTLDGSFAGPGPNGPLHDLRTQGENDNGNILIGGNFSTYNGVGRNNVARLRTDGSLDPTFNPGSGTNGRVYAIRWTRWGNYGPTIGKATIGGAFTTYNGTSMPGIVQVIASQPASLPFLPLLLD